MYTVMEITAFEDGGYRWAVREEAERETGGNRAMGEEGERNTQIAIERVSAVEISLMITMVTLV